VESPGANGMSLGSSMGIKKGPEKLIKLLLYKTYRQHITVRTTVVHKFTGFINAT
jgi:hypothetical protein